MAGGLDGKIALITGIGRAAALVFARVGARVVATDLSADGVKETVSLIERAGGQAVSVVADMTRAAEIMAMLTAEWPEEAFDKITQVNLEGVWLCMKAELEQMVRQGGGSIVNTASLAGLTGFKTTAGYAASKHGVVGLTKTARLEYAPGIHLNCVCPGFVDTDVLGDTMARRGGEILGRVPFGELARPDDIAEMVCWLSSDRARYVSGSVFTVDGAYMAG